MYASINIPWNIEVMLRSFDKKTKDMYYTIIQSSGEYLLIFDGLHSIKFTLAGATHLLKNNYVLGIFAI